MREKLIVACALACASCGRDYSPPGGTQSGSDPAVDAAPSGDAAVNATIPCDVHAVLAAHCTTCHGDPPTNNAPYPLATYADLVRVVDGFEVAQRALGRMTNTSTPMPPPPAAPVTSSEVATFATWVNAGTPSGDPNACTIPDPFAAPPQCTSGAYWTMGDTPSPLMRPGAPCVSCHPMQNVVGGTVYATGHEPDECDGAGGVIVVITDATGATQTLVTNDAGNFFTPTSVAFPIHAQVVTSAGTRSMVHGQTSGDCNACHTQSGANGAPGRIAVP